MMGGVRRAGGPTELRRPGPGLGVGTSQRVVFLGDVAFLDSGTA
jgi:hypothetical protein